MLADADHRYSSCTFSASFALSAITRSSLVAPDLAPQQLTAPESWLSSSPQTKASVGVHCAASYRTQSGLQGWSIEGQKAGCACPENVQAHAFAACALPTMKACPAAAVQLLLCHSSCQAVPVVPIEVSPLGLTKTSVIMPLFMTSSPGPGHRKQSTSASCSCII